MGLLNWVRSFRKDLLVISFRSDRSRQRTAGVFPREEEIDDARKVVFRSPAEFGPCSLVK